MKYTITVSGGGVRSSAGVGVIRYLEEQGHEIVAVSGTSGGAIMAILYGYGLTTFEIQKVINGFKKKELFKPTLGSLFSLSGIANDVREAIKDRKQKIPIEICTTNLEKGDAEYHRDGDLVQTMVASSTLQMFFKPAILNNEIHFDGGYSDNLPNINLIKDFDVENISINVNNLKKNYKKKQYAKRLFRIQRKSTMKYQISLTNNFIDVTSISDVNLFDLSKFDFCIEEGYLAAKEYFENK